MSIGLDLLGQPCVTVPATHRAALAKLTLPAGLAARVPGAEEAPNG